MIRLAFKSIIRRCEVLVPRHWRAAVHLQPGPVPASTCRRVGTLEHVAALVTFELGDLGRNCHGARLMVTFRWRCCNNETIEGVDVQLSVGSYAHAVVLAAHNRSGLS